MRFLLRAAAVFGAAYTISDKLIGILNNSQPFENLGKAIKKPMETWKCFVNRAFEYLSIHEDIDKKYISFAESLKECVNSSSDGIIRLKLNNILNSQEYKTIIEESVLESNNQEIHNGENDTTGEDEKMNFESNYFENLCCFLGVTTNDYGNYYILNPFANIENDKLTAVESYIDTIKIKTKNNFDDKAYKCFYCEFNTNDIETDDNGNHLILEKKLTTIKPLSSQQIYEIVTPYDDSINKMDDYRTNPYAFDCDTPSTDYIYIEVGEHLYGPFTWTEGSDQKIFIEPKAQNIDEPYIINSVKKEDISEFISEFNVLHNREYIKRFLCLMSSKSKALLCKYDFIDNKTLIDLVSIKTANSEFTRKEKQVFQQKVKELPNSDFSDERKKRMLEIITAAEQSDTNIHDLISDVFDRKLCEDDFWKTTSASQFVQRVLNYVKASENDDIKDEFFSLIDSREEYREIKEKKNEELSKIDNEIEQAKTELERIQKEKDKLSIIEVNKELEDKQSKLSELSEKVAELEKKYNLGKDYELWKVHFDTRKETEEENLSQIKAKAEKEKKSLEDTVKQLTERAEKIISNAYVGVAFNDVFSNMIVNTANEYQNNQISRSFETSLKSPSSDSAMEFNSANELIDYVAKSVNRYDNNDIANILLCISQGFLTVFAGKPGTGKTSFCERVSKVIGLDRNIQNESRFVEVAVEKGWTSKRDFIGYFNPITRSFDKVNKDVYSAIKLLDSEASNGINDYPFFILLDEANLSPMEHYWADFMKVCDSDNNQVINIGEANDCRIAKTLRFLATINYDTTTETLSPRLLDRAWIIDLDSDIDFDDLSDNDIEPIKSIVSYSDFVRFFGADFKLTKERENEISDDIKSKLNRIYEISSHFISISPRVRKAVLKYYYIAKENNLFNDPENTNIALDYAVAQKILPLINAFDGYENNVKKDLEELEKLFSNKTWPKCNAIIQQIMNKSYNGYYNYFNR